MRQRMGDRRRGEYSRIFEIIRFRDHYRSQMQHRLVDYYPLLVLSLVVGVTAAVVVLLAILRMQSAKHSTSSVQRTARRWLRI